MKNPVSALIKDQIQAQFYAQAAKKLNLDLGQSQDLVVKALPTLIKGMAINTQSKNGAKDLFGALTQKKHDGNILDSNQDFFADSNLDEGDKILKHILGDTRDDIAAALAFETKTDTHTAKKTLAALSPLVMGALGKAVQSKKLNADQVSSILNIALKEKDFAKAGNRIALLMLDKNNNGQYKDDLFEMGKVWLSKLLSKKKK
ncbi:DUF937 domain-containing protein [bacterium]|nr:DUF937 domain-containing protein [bacterium]NCQ55715.1 DUF937 domain-containing protein [Candidatus Parcubacteria bacterium]NCS67664.1 DUF937 domain-containing protein [Candidatus Peregrinibacteria bacterium]NCS96678.1 DUF937 domain-containing protein [bacterium]